MQQEEINRLLVEIISIYAGPHGRKGAKRAASRLPISSVEERIPIAAIPFAGVRDTFTGCGMLLEEKEDTLAGVILAGAMDMNPAFVVVRAEDSVLHITAQAKEGLINQHTAEKAIQKFKSALSLPKGSEEKRNPNEKAF